MFEYVKQMQKQGVFKLPYIDQELDERIQNATKEEDIIGFLDEIQTAIKTLDLELSDRSNVKLKERLYDFYDKISYELPKLFASEIIEKDGSISIYEKDISFGRNSKGLLGLSSLNENVMFTLEEQKLLKLINHFYISLNGNDDYNDDDFYIPIKSLQTMFKEDSNLSLNKSKIIDTCTLLNNKRVTWDFSDTFYNSKLSKMGLAEAYNQKMVDITVLYYPRQQKMTRNNKTKQISTTLIKGIICKPTDIMRLRYELAQISDRFPKSMLSGNYLDYTITDNLVYYLNLKDADNSKNRKRANSKYLNANQKETYKSKINNDFKKDLGDFIRSLDLVYDNSNSDTDKETKPKPIINSYMSVLIRDPNQKRRLGMFYYSFIESLKRMIDSNSISKVYFEVNRNEIPITIPYSNPISFRQWDNVHNEIIVSSYNKSLRINNLIRKLYNIISEEDITEKNHLEKSNEIKKTLHYYQFSNPTQTMVDNNIINATTLEPFRNIYIKNKERKVSKRITFFNLLRDGEICIRIEI